VTRALSSRSGAPVSSSASGKRLGRSRSLRQLASTVWGIFGLVALAAFFLLGGRTGIRYLFDGFPSSLAGTERIQDWTIDGIEGEFEDQSPFENIDVELAAYGEDGIPKYVIFVVELPEGASVEEYVTPRAGYTTPLLIANLLTRDFHCQTIEGTPKCAWLGGEQTIMWVSAFGPSLEKLRPVAQGVRQEMTD
jgi:hypothetical protein